MERHYSLIKIKDKLESLTWFCGGSGTIFQTPNHIYAFPRELEITIADRVEAKGEMGVSRLIEARRNIKIIHLHTGRLIFVDPSTSVEERILQFLGEELEEELQLTSVFDHISQASVAISSNLSLKPLLHKVMSLTEELLSNEVSAVMLVDPHSKELYCEVSRGDKSEFFEGKQTFPLGKGIAGDMALTGEAVLLSLPIY